MWLALTASPLFLAALAAGQLAAAVCVAALAAAASAVAAAVVPKDDLDNWRRASAALEEWRDSEFRPGTRVVVRCGGREAPGRVHFSTLRLPPDRVAVEFGGGEVLSASVEDCEAAE